MRLVSNVHQREYPISAARLGRLLDTLAGPDDRLWPTGWPPIHFDRPLQEGAVGGHGPIHYSVCRYAPGRLVECRFTPSAGVEGTHTFEVLPGERAGTAVLRHLLIVRPHGRMRLLWPLAIRWLHDALLEELLDRAGTNIGAPTATPTRRSAWVRALRTCAGPRLRAARPRVASAAGMTNAV